MWFIFVGNCETNEPIFIESFFSFHMGWKKHNTMLYNYMYIFYQIWDVHGWDGFHMGWYTFTEPTSSPRCQSHCVAGRHEEDLGWLQNQRGGKRERSGRWSTWNQHIVYLGGGNSNIFYVHPYLGKMSNLTNIFQRGWNHQLEIDLPVSPVLNMFTKEATRRHVHPQ